MTALQDPDGVIKVPDFSAQLHPINETEFLSGDRIEELWLPLTSNTAVARDSGVDEFRPTVITI
jgi:hypothetical protein